MLINVQARSPVILLEAKVLVASSFFTGLCNVQENNGCLIYDCGALDGGLVFIKDLLRFRFLSKEISKNRDKSK